MMKRYLFVAISVFYFLFPSVVLSQTLCQKGEVDYFSCETVTNKKIVSVCGNIANGEINDESWLQYRFGKKHAVELSYPEEKQGSVSKFEGNYFDRYNVIDLRFINGRTLYGVEFNGVYDGEEAEKRTRASGGVYVENSKAKRVYIACRKVDTGKYFNIFSQLNASIREFNGETDFLYRFYNHVSK